jgi:ATP-binding cassette subfamily B multidrug efflux pump
MEGKTVIAIAHRLSTIARMDRLIVLDAGRIVEEGTHDELLRAGGHYARLWRHQSGGFLPHDVVATETETEPPAGAPRDEIEPQPEPSVEDAPVPTRT